MSDLKINLDLALSADDIRARSDFAEQERTAREADEAQKRIDRWGKAMKRSFKGIMPERTRLHYLRVVARRLDDES